MLTLSRRHAIGGLFLLVAGSAFGAARDSMAADEMPLAIKGYDPVAYFTEGQATRGKLDSRLRTGRAPLSV